MKREKIIIMIHGLAIVFTVAMWVALGRSGLALGLFLLIPLSLIASWLFTKAENRGIIK